jgi:hypothetical protein
VQLLHNPLQVMSALFRRNTARSEPGFAPNAAPLAAEPRSAPTLRFPDDGRRSGERMGLRLDAADRLVVSSALTAPRKQGSSLWRAVAFAALFFLAAIGALSLYQGFAANLLP